MPLQPVSGARGPAPSSFLALLRTGRPCMPGPWQLLSPVVPVGLQALLSQLQQAGARDSVTAALIPAGTLVNGDLDFVTSENKAESGYCSYGSPFFKKHFLRLYFLRAVSVSQQN